MILSTPLIDRLNALRPALASAAQDIYDDWQEDEYGGGGICDDIASAFAGILADNNIDFVEHGHDGDDHMSYTAYDDKDAFKVDIPPYVYETGGGYNWTKIPDVMFDESDVEIAYIPRNHLEV